MRWGIFGYYAWRGVDTADIKSRRRRFSQRIAGGDGVSNVYHVNAEYLWKSIAGSVHSRTVVMVIYNCVVIVKICSACLRC